MSITSHTVILLMLLFFLYISSKTSFGARYLEFSDQREDTLNKATNFAVLRSGSNGVLQTNKFTICGSVYIGYFRGEQVFYTVRRNDQKTLWFSMFVENQEQAAQSYSSAINWYEGAALSNTGQVLGLRPHAWSHACSTLDLENGRVTNVINGILTHNVNITSKDFDDNVPGVFEGNLIIGNFQYKYKGSKNFNGQSEASVTNVQIFSAAMNISQMIYQTSERHCTPGDILSWEKAEWDFTGAVKSRILKNFCRKSRYPNLLPLTTKFNSQADCLGTCPRIQAGGRVPFTSNLSEARNLVQQLRDANRPEFVYTAGVWSPFIFQTEGYFVDWYTRLPMSASLWVPGQPNGGQKQPCTAWWDYASDGRVYDYDCSVEAGVQFQCVCGFLNIPVLRLRGLCKESNIESHYTLKYLNGSITYKGLTGTDIKFSSLGSYKWTLVVNLKETEAYAMANEKSYILGKQEWNIIADSFDCENGEQHKRILKMSGCNDGQFTCKNGECVKMEARCDQVLNCEDNSDEVDCSIVVLEESYRKTAPPVYFNKYTDVLNPARVKVSYTLLDVSAIREAKNEIDVKFTAEFEWRETRATYYNLKKKLSQNTLEPKESSKLWIPNLIYRNNKDNEGSRSELNKSVFKIDRQGNFTRSGIEVADEIEIFAGDDNPIFMLQSYTKDFRCHYNLRVFPFDTQVGSKLYISAV